MENGTLNLGFSLDSLDSAQTYDKPVSPPDGVSYWRILPALSPTKPLFHKYSLHWGFTNASGKKQPVQCSYPHERYCPIDARCKEVEQLLERAKANGDQAKIEEYSAFFDQWRVRNQFLYNALNAAGESVILSVGKTTHDGLIAKISEAVRPPKGPDGAPVRPPFDPTSLTDGVWFRVTRSGKGFKTEYVVDFNRVSVNVGGGETAEKLDRRPVETSLAEKIRQQIQSGSTGPLKDIHNMYEIRTAAELKGMMDGTIPLNKPKGNTVQSGPVAQSQAAPVLPQGGAIPPASTAIPPMAPPAGNPGTGTQQQPTNTSFDPAEARKRLEERLRASQNPGQQG